MKPLLKRPVSSGFSLLETVVYIALLAALSVAIVTAIYSMTNTTAAIRSTRSVTSAAASSLERMIYEIRNANSIDTASSTFNVHPGRLVLTSTDTNGNSTTTAFFLSSSGIMKILVGSTTASDLTPEDVTVSNLVFRNLTSSSSQAVKIEMTLRNTVGKSIRSTNYYHTAVLRGSY